MATKKIIVELKVIEINPIETADTPRKYSDDKPVKNNVSENKVSFEVEDFDRAHKKIDAYFNMLEV